MICDCGCPCGRKCSIPDCECECHAFDGMTVLEIARILVKVKPIIDVQAVSHMSKPKLFMWMDKTWSMQEKKAAVLQTRETVPFKPSSFTAIPLALTPQHAKLIAQLAKARASCGCLLYTSDAADEV